jgi:hypothetical protein
VLYVDTAQGTALAMHPVYQAWSMRRASTVQVLNKEKPVDRRGVTSAVALSTGTIATADMRTLIVTAGCIGMVSRQAATRSTKEMTTGVLVGNETVHEIAVEAVVVVMTTTTIGALDVSIEVTNRGKGNENEAEVGVGKETGRRKVSDERGAEVDLHPREFGFGEHKVRRGVSKFTCLDR